AAACPRDLADAIRCAGQSVASVLELHECEMGDARRGDERVQGGSWRDVDLRRSAGGAAAEARARRGDRQILATKNTKDRRGRMKRGERLLPIFDAVFRSIRLDETF